MRQNRFVTVISVVIYAICLIWFAIAGIVVLSKDGSASPNSAKKGEVCEFTAVFADEAFEVDNSVSFIPTGREHYYLMVSEDGLVKYLVRAKPSWIKKHFDDYGFAKSEDVKVKGLVTLMDYDLTKDVKKMNSELIGDGTLLEEEALETGCYIDVRYKEFGRLRIFSSVGVGVVGVLLFFGRMSGILQNNKFMKAIFGIISFGIGMLLLYTVSVAGFTI